MIFIRFYTNLNNHEDFQNSRHEVEKYSDIASSEHNILTVIHLCE